MAISGITNITFTNGQQNNPLVDFINEKFGDYVTATHEVSGAHVYCHIKDKDDHEIIKLHLFEQGGSNTNIYTYNTNGQVSNEAVSGSTKGHWSIYSCTNGLLIRVVNESSSEAWGFITVNSDGKLIYGTSPTTTTAQSPTTFSTIVWELPAYTTTATSRSAGSTSLLNMVHNGEYGEVSIAENCYFALYNQYPHTPGVLNLNDKIYLSNGWFVIED